MVDAAAGAVGQLSNLERLASQHAEEFISKWAQKENRFAEDMDPSDAKDKVLDELMAEIALRIHATRRTPEDVASFYPAIDPDEIPHPPKEDMIEIGKRICRAWNRELYYFLCKEDYAKNEKDLIVRALAQGREAGAISILASIMVGQLGTSMALAIPISAVIIRLFFVPAGQELCMFWHEKLQESKVI